jgi:RNA polymerase sigma factor (TIGR02999 family)
MPTSPGPITALLRQWSNGDDSAFPALIALAYDDLRAIAHRRLMVVGGAETLGTTALVNEAYLKLLGGDGGSWDSRAHFYAFASRAMRHILVDHARRENAEKRGGDRERVPMHDALAVAGSNASEVIGVDEALEHLATKHPRMAQIVELRFFGGFTNGEIAEALNTSLRTVEREWMRARAYLLETVDANAGA